MDLSQGPRKLSSTRREFVIRTGAAAACLPASAPRYPFRRLRISVVSGLSRAIRITSANLWRGAWLGCERNGEVLEQRWIFTAVADALLGTIEGNLGFDVGDSREAMLNFEMSSLGGVAYAIESPQAILAVAIDKTFDNPEIFVFLEHPGTRRAWLATQGEPTAGMVSSGNNLAQLIDGAGAFAGIANLVEQAQTSISISQISFDVDFIAKYLSENSAVGPQLIDRLIARSNEGIAVRILLRFDKTILGLGENSSYWALMKYLKQREHRIAVRTFRMSLQTFHAKMLIVDDRDAVIIGSPFERGYWDTPEHRITEPRRAKAKGLPPNPMHDISIGVRGDAANDVLLTFNGLWAAAAHEPLPPTQLSRPIPPELAPVVQVVRTIPANAGVTAGGETGVFESYLRAISQARSLIYIENQYFTNSTIVELIRRRLDDVPALRAIIVLNENPDLPLYPLRQFELLQKAGLLDHPRAGVYALWSFSPSSPTSKPALSPIYVHSKMGFVDDRWVTIGTANADGVSLDRSREYIWTHLRNVEVNISVYDPTNAHDKFLFSVRDRLWSEHLGVSSEQIDQHRADPLDLWRSAAERNVATLRGAQPTLQGHVLPFVPAKHLRDQLSALGIDSTGFTLGKEGH